MAKRYGYRPTGSAERDQIYPSEIAAQRPALATKVDCASYADLDPCDTIRGDHGAGCYCSECSPSLAPPAPGVEEHEESESAVDRFNRQLRNHPLRGE